MKYREVKPGDLLLVDCPGYPLWPVFVTDDKELSDENEKEKTSYNPFANEINPNNPTPTNVNKKVPVIFINDPTYLFVKPSKLKRLTPEICQNFLDRYADYYYNPEKITKTFSGVLKHHLSAVYRAYQLAKQYPILKTYLEYTNSAEFQEEQEEKSTRPSGSSLSKKSKHNGKRSKFFKSRSSSISSSFTYVEPLYGKDGIIKVEDSEDEGKDILLTDRPNDPKNHRIRMVFDAKKYSKIYGKSKVVELEKELELLSSLLPEKLSREEVKRQLHELNSMDDSDLNSSSEYYQSDQEDCCVSDSVHDIGFNRRVKPRLAEPLKESKILAEWEEKSLTKSSEPIKYSESLQSAGDAQSFEPHERENENLDDSDYLGEADDEQDYDVEESNNSIGVEVRELDVDEDYYFNYDRADKRRQYCIGPNDVDILIRKILSELPKGSEVDNETFHLCEELKCLRIENLIEVINKYKNNFKGMDSKFIKNYKEIYKPKLNSEQLEENSQLLLSSLKFYPRQIDFDSKFFPGNRVLTTRSTIQDMADFLELHSSVVDEIEQVVKEVAKDLNLLLTGIVVKEDDGKNGKKTTTWPRKHIYVKNRFIGVLKRIFWETFEFSGPVLEVIVKRVARVSGHYFNYYYYKSIQYEQKEHGPLPEVTAAKFWEVMVPDNAKRWRCMRRFVGGVDSLRAYNAPGPERKFPEYKRSRKYGERTRKQRALNHDPQFLKFRLSQPISACKGSDFFFLQDHSASSSRFTKLKFYSPISPELQHSATVKPSRKKVPITHRSNISGKNGGKDSRTGLKIAGRGIMGICQYTRPGLGRLASFRRKASKSHTAELIQS